MKKLLLSVSLACMLATPAYAAPYVSVSTGLGLAENSSVTYSGVSINDFLTYKSAVPVVGAVGIKNDGYRIEVAIGYQSHDVDQMKQDLVHLTSVSGSSASIFSYLVNGYYDIDVKGGITPYLTAGLGGASITAKSTGSSDTTSSGFAYQLGAGVGIKASENVVIDLGYRFFKPSSFNVYNTTDISATSNNFLVGVRYNF